ncbi:hypothetical protein ILUMI_12461 [Ignelater luminosus]|uniref:RNA-directed DNA polymerase n=1 Tax=Ignelater luminosus TaxID=2038154 RepID=A0A8K0GCX6_IGNLU|nr:hypothetical protein ILUMI_12461 [Ignelater luminosus]
MESKALQPMQLTGNQAENWKRWKQRFEIYAKATELHKKDEEIRCAQLLFYLGEDVIPIYNTFVFKDGEKDKIEILKTKFENYFLPKKNITYERYKFFSSRQGEEVIDTFITDLKNKASQCEFDTLKDDLIKTMLITGMSDEAVREELLQRENITLEKTIECCILTKSSRQQLQEMQTNSRPTIKEADAVNKHGRIDTGSNANIISLENLKSTEYNLKKIYKTNDILLAYNGQKIPIMGKCKLQIKFKDMYIKNVDFYVCNKENQESILSLDTLLKLKIIKLDKQAQIRHVNIIENDINSDYKILIDKFKNIFKGIGKIGKPYHIEIDENSKPVNNPIRNIPFMLEHQFKDCLKKLEQMQIIKRVEESSEWLNSYVLVRKSDGTLRICLDPRDLNQQLILADTLSRANIKEKYTEKLDLEAHVCIIEKKVNINDERLTKLQEATNQDDELKTLKNYIRNGWPKSINKLTTNFKPYYKLRSEITIGANDLIYMNQRIIIPLSWRSKILQDVHTGHLGITKCIQRAKNSVYWPNINLQIENLIKKCLICNKYSNSNQKEPMIPHEIKNEPWQKVGMDIYEINNQTFLIIVDYYSKYPEIMSLHNDLTVDNIINKMKAIFSRHGIPKIVMSDSAKQFNSLQYKEFASKWNFQIQLSSPHHQQSNGQVERTIQTIKKLIKKSIEGNEDIYLSLLAYRNTPIYNSFTPAQILMSRHLRNNLVMHDKKLTPKVIDKNKFRTIINSNHQKSKTYYDKKGTRVRNNFNVNDKVWYQIKPKSNWFEGKIIKQLNERTYKLVREDGRHLVRNEYYLKKRINNSESLPCSHDNFVYDRKLIENSEVHTEANPSESSVNSDRQAKRAIKTPKKFKDYIVYK